MTRSFVAGAGDSSEPTEGDDPDDTGAADAPVEGEHSEVGADAEPGQATLDAFADGADGDRDAFDVRAEIERIDRDIEHLVDLVDTLSDSVTRILGGDEAEAAGDGDTTEDGAGAACDGDCIDTPDDDGASRGYQ